MVENAKSILKRMFHELLGKTKLHIIFVPGTVTWCALLHNLFIARKEINIDKIMNTLAKKKLELSNYEELSNILHIDRSRDGTPFVFMGRPIVWVYWVSIMCHNFCNLPPFDYCCFKLFLRIYEFEACKKLITLHFDQWHDLGMFPIWLLGFPGLHFKQFWMLLVLIWDEFSLPCPLTLSSWFIDSCTCRLLCGFHKFQELTNINWKMLNWQMRLSAVFALAFHCVAASISSGVQNFVQLVNRDPVEQEQWCATLVVCKQLKM